MWASFIMLINLSVGIFLWSLSWFSMRNSISWICLSIFMCRKFQAYNVCGYCLCLKVNIFKIVTIIKSARQCNQAKAKHFSVVLTCYTFCIKTDYIKIGHFCLLVRMIYHQSIKNHLTRLHAFYWMSEQENPTLSWSQWF